MCIVTGNRICRAAMGVPCCYGCTVLLWVYRAAMGVPCCYGCTVLLWVYRAAMGVPCCYGCTVLLWVYRAAMGVPCCYGCTFALFSTVLGSRLYIDDFQQETADMIVTAYANLNNNKQHAQHKKLKLISLSL